MTAVDDLRVAFEAYRVVAAAEIQATDERLKLMERRRVMRPVAP